MALVNCNECRREISSRARTCPNCGSPQSLSTVTYEKTSKEVKSEYLSAGGLIILGFIIMVTSGNNGENKSMIIFGMITIGIGLIWLIKTKVKDWWNHG